MVYMFLLSFGISFLVYLITLCPTVYFGDSGEFITAAYCLGIPHNPGYPLYCLLGHIFIKFIQWKTIAFRVNLMSAFWAGMTAGLVTLIIYRLLGASQSQEDRLKARVVSVSFALILAFSRLFWSQALIAEVYSLNCFNFCVLMYILIKWADKKDISSFYFFFFFLGLSLCGHLSILCYIPAFIVFILLKAPSSSFSIKKILKFSLLCLLGLSLYLYLPIRSLANPPLDWGNPENLNNLARHITGYEHRQRFIGQPDIYSISSRIKEIFNLYRVQFSLPCLIAGVIGCLGFTKAKMAFSFMALFIFIGDFIYTLFLNTAPISATAFGLPSFILFSVGMSLLFFRISRRLSASLVSICLSLPFVLFLNNFYICNMNNFYLGRQYAVDILENLPENAVLLSEGDAHLFPILYLKVVENMRSDIEVIDRGGTLFRDVYELDKVPLKEREKRKRALNKNIILTANRPVYFTSKPDVADIQGRYILPEGIAFRVAKIGEKIDGRNILLRGLSEITDVWLERDFWVREVASDYLYFCGERERFYKQGDGKYFYETASSAGHDSKFNHLRLARAYLESGDFAHAEDECQKALGLDAYFIPANFILGEIYFEMNKFFEAKIQFEKVIAKNPDNAGAHNNLGLAFMRTGDLENAKKQARMAIGIDPGLWYPYLLLADICQKQGDALGADIYLKKAKELNPNL